MAVFGYFINKYVVIIFLMERIRAVVIIVMINLSKFVKRWVGEIIINKAFGTVAISTIAKAINININAAATTASNTQMTK